MPAEFRTGPGIRTRSENRRGDPLWELARRQHGVVALRQAEALGRSRSAVGRLVANGTLHKVLPRTYAVAGAASSPEQRAMAAVLWAKAVAVASHDTAAGLWGVVRASGPVHLTCARTLTSPPPGIRCHTASLPARDRGRLRGIPVTSPARTLLDLATTRSDDELLPIVEAAVLGELVTPAQLRDVVERNRGRRGCNRLARAIATATSSALERRVETILLAAELPPFVREHPVRPYRLDFAWPEDLVAIEADGRRWHSAAAGFERDRAKSNYLTARGWRVLRVTWSDLDGPGTWLAAAARLLNA